MKRIAILLIALLMTHATAYAEPVRYTGQIHHLTIDADVFGADRTQAAVLSAHNLVFDEATAAAVLLSDVDVHERGLSLKTRTSDDITELVNLSIEPYCRYMLPSFDMGFMSREEATGQALELAHALGLDCARLAIYSVTRTHYNDRYDHWVEFNKGLSDGDWGPADLPKKVDWLYEDLCYVVFLRQQYDGIPLDNGSYRLNGEMRYASGPDIYLSIGPNGLINFVATDAVSIESAAHPPVDILPYQEAARRFAESPLSTYEGRIERMTLSYIPTERSETFTLRPAWIIEAASGDALGGVDYFAVDAITGEVKTDD